MTPEALQIAREALYRLSPSSWCRRELKLDLDPWQVRMTDAPGGSRTIALVHRQAGKTTAMAVALASTMTRRLPGSTSLVLAPTQRQSALVLDRTRDRLLQDGQRLVVDNAFSLKLENGSKCVGLPGSDDAGIRGLSIDGDLCVDEAARVQDALYEAAKPMTVRHARTARILLVSTAWAKKGFFYDIWSKGDPRDWTKIEAKIQECRHLTAAEIEVERRSMSPTAWAREYENQFDSTDSRFFSQDDIDNAFGGMGGVVPPLGDVDPIVGRRSAFNRSLFA